MRMISFKNSWVLIVFSISFVPFMRQDVLKTVHAEKGDAS